jgi:SAM-dependent methyltransferase
MSKEFWNERYSQHQTVYGFLPNEFFKEQLDLLAPGNLFLPAEGEGRNALYAASKGWHVTACDYSEVAKSKAEARAKELAIHTLTYSIQDLSTIELPEEKFDAIALVYVHLPEPVRNHLYKQCVKSLKPGGRIIIEVFSEKQLQYNSGGPKELTLLSTASGLARDFQALKIIYQKECEVELKEGPFHNGPAHVVRMVLEK